MNVYCDTDTLLNNVARHATDDQKSQRQLNALEGLLALHQHKKIRMHRSRVALRELERTKDSKQRERLKIDYEALEQIQNDEKYHGSNIQYDQYGGSITSPLVSDVQDERLSRELQEHGLSPKDAEHITQAVCNDCRVFLTRDEGSIINPHRDWLERRFPNLKIRLPSELLVELSV